MTLDSPRKLIALGGLLFGWCVLAAGQDQKPDPLAEYRGPEKATAAKITPVAADRVGQTGYLGAAVKRDDAGRPVVEEVQPDSPAAKAGLKPGDVITQVGDQAVRTPNAFREWLQGHGPGETIKLGLLRDGQPVTATAMLVSTSRPMRAAGGGGGGPPRVYHGLQLAEPTEGEGVRVEQVAQGSPASTAGLKAGDLIVKLDGKEPAKAPRLPELVAEKRPGDVLTVVVRRDAKDVELKVTLAAPERRGFGGGGGGFQGFPVWKKEVIRLGVVPFEFTDVKHNAKVTAKDLDQAFFSTNAYRDKSVTGQRVFGSLNDYFREQSYGALRIEGKVFDWVEVGKKRNDYVQGSGTSNKTAPLVDALAKVAARDGKDALDGFDALLFVYAGDRVRGNRGSVYAPHAGYVSRERESKRFPYLLGAEGGSSLTPVNGFVKELGLVLGLPDLAARTENIGSEGLGPWCAMSDPGAETRPGGGPTNGGRPPHLSAWAKEKLGWLKPTPIDPTVKQKLVLAPVEDSATECFKVLVRPDGSEYLLLENRRRKGFDELLPGEGLLIWRVVADRPILEESHGIEGPAGPTNQLASVPYPSAANNAFTPDTTPSSRSPRGGGLPVHITEVRKAADGRVTFQIGYEYR